MTVLVFQRTRDSVQTLFSRFSSQKNLWSSLKIAFLLLWFMINVVLYLLYLNLSSTQGYRYRQAQQELEWLRSEIDLLKLDVVQQRKDVWDRIQDVDIISLDDVAHRVLLDKEIVLEH